MVFYLKKYNEISQNLSKFSEGKDIKTTVIVVTKNRSFVDIMKAFNAGIRHFGEIRIQEAFNKYLKLKFENKDLKLHMIGSLQTNKVKKALKIFDYFHSLDRNSLAFEFSKYAECENKFFFIQVNTGEEKQKSGIYPKLTSEFVKYCLFDLKLNVIGLMCLPPINDDPKEHFLMLNELALKNNLKHLSIGMSGDYRIAIECGATYIRIGSSFFG